MSNPARVVVLAEDSRHQQFVRRVLNRLGYQTQEIRFLPLPAGKGSGEQYVRNKYAAEVIEHRRRAARAEKAFVVIIDADNRSVAQRQEQFAAELTAAARLPRHDFERICHLIPKRHVETWIFCLNGESVDETASYRTRQINPTDVNSAALAFFEWSRPGATPPSQCLPSLAGAFSEIRRLD